MFVSVSPRLRDDYAMAAVCPNLLFSACFFYFLFYVNSQSLRESTVSSLSSHVTAHHPSLFFFFNMKYSPCEQRQLPASSFHRHSQMSAAASHLYLEFGKQKKLDLALQSSSILICRFFSFPFFSW